MDGTTLFVGLAKVAGPKVARRILRWAEGSEAKKLVNRLKNDHPVAPKILTQPEILGRLWLYSETGELDRDDMALALRAIVDDPTEAQALADAVAEEYWAVVPDDRRVHFDLRRLQSEIRTERAAEATWMLDQISRILDRKESVLPAARQLPAETADFVDRDDELEVAGCVIKEGLARAGARMVCVSGLPGSGKSAFAVHVAHAHSRRFSGAVVHVRMRDRNGAPLQPAEVATHILRDIGIDAEAIPVDHERRLALLRSALADQAVLLVLEDAVDENQVRDLIPASSKSAVIVTCRGRLGKLGGAELIDMGPLTTADGMKLLSGLAPAQVEADSVAAQHVVEACDGLPLAIAVIGGRLRRSPSLSLSELADDLGVGAVTALDDHERAIETALDIAIASASDDGRRLVLLMGALQVGDVDPPLAAALLDVSEHEARALLRDLADERLLVALEGGRFRPHALIRSHAEQIAADWLTTDEVASAASRRVEWLMQFARDRGPDLRMAE